MKHLRNFNENASDKILSYTKLANEILNNEDYSKIDMLSELGELANELNMNSDDLRQVIASNRIKNDYHKFVQEILNDTIKEETPRNSWRHVIDSLVINIPQGCDSFLDDLIRELEEDYNVPTKK